MGMSTHVVGFKPPDDKWKKMKAVYDACQKAGINPPEEVFNFFGGSSEPDDQGVEVAIQKLPCTKKFSSESKQGFEIDLKKLPPDVTVIRFYNSY